MTFAAGSDVITSWERLALALGLPDTVLTTGRDRLADAYGEPHRHYHTVTHIKAMLDGAAAVHAAFNDPDVAELAILFHDLVYDPARNDNEAQSAGNLRQLLDGHMEEARLERACAHILATRRHEPMGDPDTDLVLDLDMAILGAAWSYYLDYARGVYQEYRPVYGPDAYAHGRVALFLEPCLAKTRIFLTQDFSPLEVRARENLARERVLWLSGGLDQGVRP